MQKTTLRQQLEAFKQGRYLDSRGEESWCYNFFDWFCKDTSLKAKSDKLFRQVQKFVKVMEIDQDKHYVFFKNNCPMNGPLYDDFRICSIETGEVIWNVTAKSGHTGEAEAYWREKGFNKPYATGKNFTHLMDVCLFRDTAQALFDLGSKTGIL